MTEARERIRTFLKRAEVDRAVIFGLLSRIWAVIAAPGTALLIAFKFSPQLQGYYYTFASVLAFQSLIELGLGNIILQFASHERAKLTIDDNGHIYGDEGALSRLQSLISFALRWYFIAAIISACILSILGYLFFLKDSNTVIYWKAPWLVLCVLNGIIFCMLPFWSILEGCNQVTQLYRFRFIQGFCISLAMWTALFLEGKLWVMPVASVMNILCSLIFLFGSYKSFFRTLLSAGCSRNRISWSKEILPLQWRVTISYFVGSFAYLLFTPVLFSYHGAVVAGQFGMTWNLIGIMMAIANSWLAPKIPQFGMLVARREFEKLDKMMFKMTKIVAIISILTAFCIEGSVLIINELDHPIFNRLALRLLSPLSTGIFLIAQVIQIMLIPMSQYLRAHKKEPLVIPSVLQGILTALSVLILGKYYSVNGMGFGLLIINALLLPVVYIVWQNCRVKWHMDTPDS